MAAEMAKDVTTTNKEETVTTEVHVESPAAAEATEAPTTVFQVGSVKDNLAVVPVDLKDLYTTHLRGSKSRLRSMKV